MPELTGRAPVGLFMNKRWVIGPGVGLLLAGGLAWWHYGPAMDVADGPRSAAPAEFSPETGSPGTADDSATEADPSPPGEFAYRLPPVPPARPGADAASPSTDERDITAENIDELVQANLAHALQGDMASAYFVSRSRLSCDQFASTPAELEQAIERTNQRTRHAQARGYEFPAATGYDQPWSVGPDETTNRVNLERWYDACGRLREIFTADLRQRLESLALRGDVMARYLYATWPEELLEAGEAFARQFRWEDRAREFSLANLEAGEVAGMMAFGQSYLSGWFTNRDPNLALAFGVAALNCGFETLSIRSFLASSIDRLTGSDDPADRQRLAFIIAEADNLSQGCRT